jgi:hypothetical protein
LLAALATEHATLEATLLEHMEQWDDITGRLTAKEA